MLETWCQLRARQGPHPGRDAPVAADRFQLQYEGDLRPLRLERLLPRARQGRLLPAVELSPRDRNPIRPGRQGPGLGPAQRAGELRDLEWRPWRGRGVRLA